MGKVTKHNNKVHIAQGKDNPAKIFTKVTDILTGEESHTALDDSLLRPGGGSATSGDVTFVLHGADCGIGAIAIVAKGASILVYTTDGGNTPREMKISGADNIELIAVHTSSTQTVGGFDTTGYIYFVDNKSSGLGSVVYALPFDTFDTFLVADGLADLSTYIVEFDFTDQVLGRYGAEIEPYDTDSESDTFEENIALGNLGAGFSESVSEHFLHDKKTENGLNHFYVTDLKFGAGGGTTVRGFMYAQFTDIDRRLDYNANECVVYRWQPSAAGGDHYNINMTNTAISFEPAFFPCEFLGASRSLISDEYIDNGGDTSYFNTEVSGNNDWNQTFDEDAWEELDVSSFPSEANFSTDYYGSGSDLGDAWEAGSVAWAHELIDSDAQADLYGQLVPSDESNADFMYSKKVSDTPWSGSGGADLHCDTEAVIDMESALNSFFYHGSARVMYLKQALAYNNIGSAIEDGGNGENVHISSMSVLAGPSDSNYWLKYRQLLVIDGFDRADVMTSSNAYTQHNTDAENIASMLQATRTRTTRVSSDSILSFPCFPSDYIPAQNSTLTGLARYNVSNMLSDIDYTASVYRFWGTELHNTESRSNLTSSGHCYFVVNNNGEAPSVVTMKTIKATGISDGSDYNPMYHGYSSGNEWPLSYHSSGDLFTSHGVRNLTDFGSEDISLFIFINTIATLYDEDGCRPWEWSYTGVNTDDAARDLKYISVWNAGSIAYSDDGNLKTILPHPWEYVQFHENADLCPLAIDNPSFLLLEHHIGMSMSVEGSQKYFDYGNMAVHTSTQPPPGLNSILGDTAYTTISDGDKFDHIQPTSDGTEASIIFNLSVTGQASDGTDAFIAPFTVRYKYSFTYDGHQESPLSLLPVSVTEALNDKSTILVKVEYLPETLDPRITHVNIYSQYIKSNGSGDSSYKLSKSIPFRPLAKWSLQTETGLYKSSYFDDNSTAPSYESLTGIGESITNNSMQYNLSAQSDSYLFVGDCLQPSLSDDFTHYIFRSMQGKFSQFNWSRDYQILPEVPTAMVSFNGRLFVFSANMTFRLNQATLEVEDVFEGVGCDNPSAVITTEYGMCFADQNNIYLHNGSNPQVISQTIARGSRDSYTDGSGGWQDNTKSYIRVSFDAIRKSYLIFFSYSYQGDVYNRCWAYNILYKRWDLLSSPERVTNTFIENDGTVLITTKDRQVYRYMSGSTLKNWTWTSKDLIMGGATQDKKIKKVRINSSDSIASGDINVSYDNGVALNTTLKEELGGALKHTSLTPDTRASFKSLRVSLTDIVGTNEVDSIGIIYRPRSIK